MSVLRKILLISFTVSMMVFVTFIKSEVRSLKHETQVVIKEQEQLEESIQVLEAEYTYLTSPVRLAKISEDLNLRTIDYNSTKPQLVSLRYSE